VEARDGYRQNVSHGTPVIVMHVAVPEVPTGPAGISNPGKLTRTHPAAKTVCQTVLRLASDTLVTLVDTSAVIRHALLSGLPRWRPDALGGWSAESSIRFDLDGLLVGSPAT